MDTSLISFTYKKIVLNTTRAIAASYAVTAAMKIAVTKSNPSIYLPMTLAITFPFNITIGMPIYLSIINL